jgi:membrane-bound serine protease (ClpP class)
VETYLIWALVLFFVGLLIAVVEVVVPSAGLLALASLAALVGSLVCAYQLSGWALAGLAVVEAVCVPAVVVIALRVLPRTSVGRRMMLEPPSTGGVGPSATGSAGDYRELLGMQGRVVTPLRPSGTAEISGRRVSVVSTGEMIPDGQEVRVVEVEGNRIVVESLRG